MDIKTKPILHRCNPKAEEKLSKYWLDVAGTIKLKPLDEGRTIGGISIECSSKLNAGLSQIKWHDILKNQSNPIENKTLYEAAGGSVVGVVIIKNEIISSRNDPLTLREQVEWFISVFNENSYHIVELLNRDFDCNHAISFDHIGYYANNLQTSSQTCEVNSASNHCNNTVEDLYNNNNVGLSALHLCAKYDKIVSLEVILKHPCAHSHGYSNVTNLNCRVTDSPSDQNQNHAHTNSSSNNSSALLTNENKKTPLHYACEYKSLECLKLLLKHGANIELVDSYRESCLHKAARSQFRTGIQLLVQYSSSLLETTAGGHHKCSSKNKIKINRQNVYGQSPVLVTKSMEIIKYFLLLGADPYIIDKSGQSLFIVAVRSNNSKLLRNLIAFVCGTSHVVEDKENRISAHIVDTLLLHEICTLGHMDCLKALVHGILERDSYGATGYSRGLSVDDDASVVAHETSALSKVGSSIRINYVCSNSCSYGDMTPLMLACKHGHNGLVEFLLETFIAPITHSHATCGLLAEQILDVNAENYDGSTALTIALLRMQESTVAVLLRKCPHIAYHLNSRNETALEHLSRVVSSELVDIDNSDQCRCISMSGKLSQLQTIMVLLLSQPNGALPLQAQSLRKCSNSTINALFCNVLTDGATTNSKWRNNNNLYIDIGLLFTNAFIQTPSVISVGEKNSSSSKGFMFVAFDESLRSMHNDYKIVNELKDNRKAINIEDMNLKVFLESKSSYINDLILNMGQRFLKTEDCCVMMCSRSSRSTCGSYVAVHLASNSCVRVPFILFSQAEFSEQLDSLLMSSSSSKTNTSCSLYLQQYDQDVFAELVHYLETGVISVEATSEDAIELLQLAHHLGLYKLETMCEVAIVNNALTVSFHRPYQSLVKQLLMAFPDSFQILRNHLHKLKLTISPPNSISENSKDRFAKWSGESASVSRWRKQAAIVSNCSDFVRMESFEYAMFELWLVRAVGEGKRATGVKTCFRHVSFQIPADNLAEKHSSLKELLDRYNGVYGFITYFLSLQHTFDINENDHLAENISLSCCLSCRRQSLDSVGKYEDFIVVDCAGSDELVCVRCVKEVIHVAVFNQTFPSLQLSRTASHRADDVTPPSFQNLVSKACLLTQNGSSTYSIADISILFSDAHTNCDVWLQANSFIVSKYSGKFDAMIHFQTADESHYDNNERSKLLLELGSYNVHVFKSLMFYLYTGLLPFNDIVCGSSSSSSRDDRYVEYLTQLHQLADEFIVPGLVTYVEFLLVHSSLDSLYAEVLPTAAAEEYLLNKDDYEVDVIDAERSRCYELFCAGRDLGIQYLQLKYALRFLDSVGSDIIVTSSTAPSKAVYRNGIEDVIHYLF